MPLTTQQIGVLLRLPELARADERALLAKMAFEEQWAHDRLGGIAQGDASRSADGALIEQAFWLGARCAQGDEFAQKEAFGPRGALSLAAARRHCSGENDLFSPDGPQADFVAALDEEWVGSAENQEDGEWIEVRKPKSSQKALSETDQKLREKRLREELAHVFSRGFMAACQDAIDRPDWFMGRSAQRLEKTAKKWLAMGGWRGLANLKTHCLEWALTLAVACDAPELGILALESGADANGQWAYRASFERRSSTRSMADIAVSRAIEREFLGLDPAPAWKMAAALAARGHGASMPNAIGLRVALAQRLGQSAKDWEAESAPRHGLPGVILQGLAEKTRRVGECLAAFEAADQSASAFFDRFEAEIGRGPSSLKSPASNPPGKIEQREAFEAVFDGALECEITPVAVALRACADLDARRVDSALAKLAKNWADKTHKAYPAPRRDGPVGEEDPELAALTKKQLENCSRLACALIGAKWLSESMLRDGVERAVPAYMEEQRAAVFEKMQKQMAREDARALQSALQEGRAAREDPVADSPAKRLGRRRL